MSYTEYNINTVGSLTNNNGVLSGFSTSDYATLLNAFNPGNSPWEIVLKFQVPNIAQSFELFDFKSGEHVGGFLGLYNGKIFSSLGGGGSTWIVDTDGSTTMTTNKWYYTKYEFTGSSYKIYLSESGEFNGEESLEISVNSTTPVSQNIVPRIGMYYVYSGFLPLSSYIDLNESYIKINNQIWWKGTTNYYDLTINPTPADANVSISPSPSYTPPVYNISTVGSLTNNNGIISGFSQQTNYFKFPEAFAPGASDTWEVVFKVKMNSVSATQALLRTHPQNNTTPYYDMEIYNGKPGLWFGDGSTWQAGEIHSSITFPTGTYTYLKVDFDGSTYSVSTSSDGVNYTVGASESHTYNAIPSGVVTDFGYAYGFDGEIDLNESYIKINNQIWWRGTVPGQEIGYLENTAITYSVSKEGYQTESDTFNITQDTVLNIVLHKLARNYISIGNGELIKGYVGSNEVSKIYFGDILLFEKVEPSLWDINQSGDTVTRLSLPYTLEPEFNPSYSSITAQSSFVMSNWGLRTNPTAVVDGSTISPGVGLQAYRDCTVKLYSTYGYSGSSIGIYGDYSTGGTSGDYFKLNKDGTVKEAVNQSEKYIPTTPDNFLVYDSVSGNITLKAGTYDASTSYNAPAVVSSDITLEPMGGLFWATQDWSLMLSINPPMVYENVAVVPLRNQTNLSSIKFKKIDQSSTVYASPSSTISSDQSMELGTSYVDYLLTPNIAGTGFCICNSSSSLTWGVDSGWSTIMEVTSNLTRNVVDGMNLWFELKGLTCTTSRIVLKIYDENDNATTLYDQSNVSASVSSIPVTYNQIMSTKKIEFTQTFNSSTSIAKSDSFCKLQLNGEYTGSFSKPAQINTVSADGTYTSNVGKIDSIDMGYESDKVFFNIYEGSTLQSITSTPVYPII